MYRNQTLPDQTLTDAGVIYFNPAHAIESEFEGTLGFAVTAANVSGTTAGSCQLQGSNDGTNWVDIGSPVAIADATTIHVPLGDVILYYTYYRVELTGSGTQSSTITTTYNAKGRD